MQSGKISMVQMITKSTEGKRFFEYRLKEESPAETLTFEVTIQPHFFDGKNCQLIVVRNVSHIM